MKKITSYRMKIEILKLVRYKLAVGHESYICYAISAAVRKLGPSYYKLGEPLRMYVRRQLRGLTLYDTWVEKYHTALYNQATNYPHAARQGRLAWVDWMIEQYEQRIKEES